MKKKTARNPECFWFPSFRRPMFSVSMGTTEGNQHHRSAGKISYSTDKKEHENETLALQNCIEDERRPNWELNTHTHTIFSLRFDARLSSIL